MEKVIFTDPDTKEKIEFYVLEETQINGKKFLFVTEEEDGDSEAYILKEIADENDDVVYEMVEDDNELAALGKVFAEFSLLLPLYRDIIGIPVFSSIELPTCSPASAFPRNPCSGENIATTFMCFSINRSTTCFLCAMPV